MYWFYCLLWFFVLILLAWPLGFIAAFFYVLLVPFTACCTCTHHITDFLMKGVQLPAKVAVLMVTGKSCMDK